VRFLLALLIRLFPPEFRRRFGAELAALARAELDRAADRGPVRAFLGALATVWDLAASAVGEWWEPTWDDGRTPTNRGEGTMRWMREGVSDLRHAVRTLRRAPGFTVVSVGTLALALGGNAGIFSVVDAVLLDPLPFADADRLVLVAGTAPGSDFPEEFSVGAEFYLQYAEQSELLEEIALFNSFTATLRADERVERIRMSMPTPSLFRTLGVTPILGRLPVPEDEDGVALISHALWVEWFGEDPEVIGRSYEMLDGRRRTVIGVMGPDFWFPDDARLWIPREVRAENVVPGRFGAPLVARMAPGVEPEALVEELGPLARRLPERFGGSPAYARLIEQHRPIVRPLREEILGDVARPLWVLMGAVGIVLLIACANVANLFVVRAEHRQRDLAVRRAIGAGRLQLLRSEIAEAVVVAALAGVLAVALASANAPALLRLAPPDIPRLAEVEISATTLLFTAAGALVCALLCGLAPALRSSAPDLTRLRDAGRGSTARRHWARNVLVAAQTALALVLLIGSALLVRSFQALRSVDPGYDTTDVLTFQIGAEDEGPNDGPSFARFHMGVMERLKALPGVESVGVVENVPLNEGVRSARIRTAENADDPEGGPLLGFTWAGGDYFATMRIDVLRGRVFTPDDDRGAEPGHVIVSRTAAELLWPGEDPVGRRLQLDGLESWETVVGVVEDVMQDDFRGGGDALVYLPLVGPSPDDWSLSSPAYVVRTSRAEEIVPDVRALVRELAPISPMYRVYTMAGLAEDSMVQLSFTMLTLGIASALALVLGVVGLYGVLSYVVAQRSQEIGVRMALGAHPSRVRRTVVLQGARVVVAGVLIGGVAALGLTRVLGSLLFGVEPVDVATFLTVSTAMIGVGLLASWLPARRASGVDPIRSLRGD
jgi:predicted permease